MKRPNRIDFENKHDVSDWLYFEPKYTKALNDYIDTLETAISVTRCCETLKTKDRIAFHVFAEINKYTKCFEGYKRDGKTFSETEVLKRYNTYLLSL
tara:strand:+ start:382 stop:672 length:291 start_codon:yes stop_codon:yes gene_type:complete